MRRSVTRTSLVVSAAALAAVLCTASGAGAATGPRLKAGQARAIPARVDPLAVACPRGTAPASTTCDVLGATNSSSEVIPVTKGTPSSSTISVPGGVDLACPGASTCAVAAVASTGAELSWVVHNKVTRTVAIAGMSYAYAVACESETTCVVAGTSYGSGSADYGTFAVVGSNATSASAHRVSGVAAFQGIACPTATSCLLVGATKLGNGLGVVVPLSHGAAGTKHTVTGTTELAHVACGNSTNCWATGFSYSSTKGVTSVVLPVTKGLPGTKHAAPAFGDQIACTSGTTCLLATATAHYGHGKIDELVKGKVTSSVIVTSLYAAPLGLTCPVATSCLVAGATGFHNPGPNYYYTGAVVPITP